MGDCVVKTFPAGPLGCNCSIVSDPTSGEAVVIDPGGDFPKIASVLDELGTRVTAIVHTHTHIDHVGATAPLQKRCGCDARIHEDDRFLYEMLPVQAAMIGVPMPEKCDLVGDLNDGASIKLGAFEIEVMHTPGHTPGSVSFVLHGTDQAIAFAGDTLFRGSIGRTDLWGGDSELILTSIKKRLLALGDDTRVITGHGPDTTIGHERRANPFVGA